MLLGIWTWEILFLVGIGIQCLPKFALSRYSKQGNVMPQGCYNIFLNKVLRNLSVLDFDTVLREIGRNWADKMFFLLARKCERDKRWATSKECKTFNINIFLSHFFI